MGEFNNIGLLKVDAALNRLKSISDSNVLVSQKRVQEALVEIESFKPDVIVDAIDDLEAKIIAY